MDKTNQNREVAIRLQGVKKRYRLGQIGGGTLTADLQSWWAKMRGKEDPNTKIGVDQRLLGTTFMALNGIDLTIYKGEAVGIIGGNGAGKSTMLKLLSRVTGPTEGDIDIYGRITSMLEVGTGFNGEMTGRENVYMNGAILGMTKAEIDAKMEEIIEFSEVRDFIDTPVKRYSSGMYVKLAFSVAAHLDSEIMIMDEVLAVGDMAFQRKCLNKMRDAANREGRTVLYVSHNMNTIRQLCDRCVVLDQGKVIFEGEVEEAIAQYLGIYRCSENTIDASKIQRTPEFCDGSVKILSWTIDGHENGIFTTDESVSGTMDIVGNRDVQSLFIRFILKTNDGVPVTMSMSSSCMNIRNGEQIKVRFDFDIGNIVPGQYNISVVLFELDKYGVNISLDGLHRIYNFQIQPILGYNQNMEWQSRYWGHFKNKNLDIKLI